MAVRFEVRRSEHGYGVWDVVCKRWASGVAMDADEAAHRADQLTIAELAVGGPRPIGTFRYFDPPAVVEIKSGDTWWPGTLDWWVQEVDGWYGRATFTANGATSWYPKDSVRRRTA